MLRRQLIGTPEKARSRAATLPRVDSRQRGDRRARQFECLERRLALSADTFLTVNTTYGPFQIELFDSVAPKTVANFLHYVNTDAYNNSIFHQSLPGFVLQGGGFTTSSWSLSSTTQLNPIVSQGTIASEAGIPNTTGTLAMALANGPNSGADEWFINLADNSSLNGSSSGGPYTVFGKVVGDGMQIVDQIAAFPRENLGGEMSNLPVDTAHNNQLAVITSITVDAGITGMVFDDANFNGAFDAGEGGISGQVIYLDANNNGALDAGEASTVTDANGLYSFPGLAPGSYVVREVVLPNHGIVMTTPPSGGAGVNVSSNNATTGPDFGNVQISPVAPLSVSTTQLPPSSDGTTAYIQAVYAALLGHTADPAGLAAWQSLMAGGASRTAVAQDIWSSPEHRGLEVDQYYQTLFGRAADPGGRAFWIDAFEAGADERVVMACLLDSGEYHRLHNTDANYIGALYFDVFDRAPDQNGLSNWMAALQKGTQSTLDAAVAFVVADESSARIIDGFFAAFLHRSGNADRANFLAALHNNTMTIEGIGVAILASDEFFANAASASGAH